MYFTEFLSKPLVLYIRKKLRRNKWNNEDGANYSKDNPH